jgi:hypothetical protein
VSVLLAVVEEGADELDRRAAQVILGMLGHLPTCPPDDPTRDGATRRW